MRATPTVILAVLALAGSASMAYAADASFQRSLSANGNVALDVCTNSGNIHIYGVDGNEIHISGKVHSSWHIFGSSKVEIEQIAAHPPIQQTGNAIHVGNGDTCGGHIFHSSIGIDYEISVPKDATVVANIGSGDIHVETVGGFVHAETGSGDIRAKGVGSDSRLGTGSGSIDVQAALGTLQAQTGSGDISIRDSRLTDASLKTGSGSITAGDVRGALKADTGSGSLTICGFPTSNWKLETGSGAIHFQADPNAKFTLDAKSGSGGINSKLPISVSGHIDRGVLRGPVNGGGPVVKMVTGSGEIDLQ
jgi:hypothetical protein